VWYLHPLHVSGDSIRIAFLVAILNDFLEVVLRADISRAYLNAKAAEKVCTITRKKFGPKKEGQIVVISVYYMVTLRSSSRTWRNHLVEMLQDGSYKSCKTEMDAWMHLKTKPDDFKYWSYILVYTDDKLVVDHELKVVIN
jgi:hypothetical protein